MWMSSSPDMPRPWQSKVEFARPTTSARPAQAQGPGVMCLNRSIFWRDAPLSLLCLLVTRNTEKPCVHYIGVRMEQDEQRQQGAERTKSGREGENSRPLVA